MIRYLAAAVAVTTPAALFAQAAPAPLAAQAAPAGPALLVAVAAVAPGSAPALPANTEILLTLNSEINSKKAKVGDTFDLTVARDVMVGNYVVIPHGTLAHGAITYRTGKGSFGKSGKMEVEMRSVEMPGHTILVTGHYRQEGQGNTGATVGAAVAVGVFSAFVTGHSAVYNQGAEFKAFTKEALPVTLPSS